MLTIQDCKLTTILLSIASNQFLNVGTFLLNYAFGNVLKIFFTMLKSILFGITLAKIPYEYIIFPLHLGIRKRDRERER